ncbi:hypothetical protein PsYK624_169120 [Phanerochaete sordida]|uniref:Phosphoglycerate mutase-like protein n=1 Tax=Phanerochaete sordida TaxID=48140 RepID=A0A9P3LPC9_9APHY|nr:hypothetical protein PsYK624_169120 [Phanerochaete sordida]
MPKLGTKKPPPPPERRREAEHSQLLVEARRRRGGRLGPRSAAHAPRRAAGGKRTSLSASAACRSRRRASQARCEPAWKFTFDHAGDAAVLPPEAKTVLILENCREEYGVHTCDLRSTLSHLRTLYTPPTYAFEAGFAEEDPLWDADERESTPHRVGRARSVLDAAFAEDATYVSITAHGGFINGFLNAVGRPNYSLPTGGVLPIVVQRTVGASAN